MKNISISPAGLPFCWCLFIEDIQLYYQIGIGFEKHVVKKKLINLVVTILSFQNIEVHFENNS